MTRDEVLRIIQDLPPEVPIAVYIPSGARLEDVRYLESRGHIVAHGVREREKEPEKGHKRRRLAS